MTSVAGALGEWAHGFEPGPADLALADRSLADTVAVALAARDHPVTRLAAALPEAGRWAVAAHVLDYDDLHMASTAHVSAVCVPTALATGGGARAYLAAAGVMARLGAALGWRHYSAGWHATCTAGAPASAAGAAVALGLPPAQVAIAMALAVPGAGGVQRAFGTDAKSLQVGFAVEAGVRAARLAAAGARADPAALDEWLALVGGDPAAAGLTGQGTVTGPSGPAAVTGLGTVTGPSGRGTDPESTGLTEAGPSGRGTGPASTGPTETGAGGRTGPAVPGGLAIKIYPCCYALQRPVNALAELASASDLDPASVRRIVLRTPEATVQPLIHHRPQTGLEGKFSLEYGAAAALLDRQPGFASFTDAAVRRPSARRLAGLVEVKLDPGGSWLLDGVLEAEVHTGGGEVLRASQQYPPGSPDRPPSAAQLDAKLADCTSGLRTDPASWTWQTAPAVLRAFLPGPDASPAKRSPGPSPSLAQTTPERESNVMI
jgi:2-methylcitrate dehydratase PrpD